MWQMLGIMAELERSLITERCKAGRAAAVARGVKMGRKPKLSQAQKKHIAELRGQGLPVATIAPLVGVSKKTIYRNL
jgi:DNA invertase Pin-like site-specific DNA recombinase